MSTESGQVHEMCVKCIVCSLSILWLLVPSYAQTTISASPEKLDAHNAKLFVDPSATKVALGKVSLTVSPLIHDGNLYSGDYVLKVVPYIFKSEKGRLNLEASEETVQKIFAGNAI